MFALGQLFLVFCTAWSQSGSRRSVSSGTASSVFVAGWEISKEWTADAGSDPIANFGIPRIRFMYVQVNMFVDKKVKIARPCFANHRYRSLLPTEKRPIQRESSRSRRFFRLVSHEQIKRSLILRNRKRCATCEVARKSGRARATRRSRDLHQVLTQPRGRWLA